MFFKKAKTPPAVKSLLEQASKLSGKSEDEIHAMVDGLVQNTRRKIDTKMASRLGVGVDSKRMERVNLLSAAFAKAASPDRVLIESVEEVAAGYGRIVGAKAAAPLFQACAKIASDGDGVLKMLEAMGAPEEVTKGIRDRELNNVVHELDKIMPQIMDTKNGPIAGWHLAQELHASFMATLETMMEASLDNVSGAKSAMMMSGEVVDVEKIKGVLESVLDRFNNIATYGYQKTAALSWLVAVAGTVDKLSTKTEVLPERSGVEALGTIVAHAVHQLVENANKGKSEIEICRITQDKLREVLRAGEANVRALTPAEPEDKTPPEPTKH